MEWKRTLTSSTIMMSSWVFHEVHSSRGLLYTRFTLRKVPSSQGSFFTMFVLHKVYPPQGSFFKNLPRGLFFTRFFFHKSSINFFFTSSRKVWLSKFLRFPTFPHSSFPFWYSWLSEIHLYQVFPQFLNLVWYLAISVYTRTPDKLKKVT